MTSAQIRAIRLFLSIFLFLFFSLFLGRTLPEHISTHRLQEAGLVTIDGKLYKLLKAMYGLGNFSICVGFWKGMDTLVRLVRWCYDFSLSGRRSLCKAFRDERCIPR